MSNPYRMLGMVLCVASAIFTPISYFILASIPLTAVGISAILIGFTCIALANTRPPLSPEACELILKTGMENTAALLEELGLRNKTIYLPSTMRNGHSQALIPLVDGENIQRVKEKIPGRLIVRNPPDVGRLRANMSRIRFVESKAARVLAQLLQSEYSNLDNNARLNPATKALSEVFTKVNKQSNIIIISHRNHDAEALAFNTFGFAKKGNAIITV
ncbi:hypothetical protein ACFLWC_07380 [Chloroflexota bacterium]